MKNARSTFLLLFLAALIAAPAFAGQPKTKTAGSDENLVAMNASFQRFAQAKIQKLNHNHQFSRSRMHVQKKANGLYCARYHEIDGSSLKYKVRRSKSKSVPYVGILSYQERVYEALGSSPETCKKGNFSTVSVIPNKHIFSYKKGTWN
jgi:hypothetical protein